MQVIIRFTQSKSFAKEIEDLENDRLIYKQSTLFPFNPFLDKFSILRVVGQLVHCALPEEGKHPILLPSNNHVTELIIREEHLRLGHAGTLGHKRHSIQFRNLLTYQRS